MSLQNDVWTALRLDLVNGAPVDRGYVDTLIAVAAGRLERFAGVEAGTYVEDPDELPAELSQAIILDVTVHYFSRVAPELPDEYWQLIFPFRKWGFGGSGQSQS